MSRVGFEPTIPVFQRAKTFHAVDRAATVNSNFMNHIAFCYVLLVSFRRRFVGHICLFLIHNEPRHLSRYSDCGLVDAFKPVRGAIHLSIRGY
jgi:hypothetical protein